MNPICFYRRADFDGVCSAAIVKKFVPDCELHGIDYGDEFPWGKIRPKTEDGSCIWLRTVYLVDFSLPPEQMKTLALSCNLVWIDHHKSALETCTQAELPRVPGIREVGRAGCELCWEWFTDSWPVQASPEAVRLLGRYDVWDKDNPEWASIEAFQFGMRAQPGAMDPENGLWKDLLGASGDEQAAYELDRVAWFGAAILSYRDQEAKSLCVDGCHETRLPVPDDFKYVNGGATLEVTGSYVKLICLNSLQRGSWQFNSVWDPEKHDAMCVYGQLKDGRWRVSLYSTKPEVDCGAICKAFGGGGHVGAAGFVCDELPWER